MSAPATEQPPVEERPTQPLPIPGTEDLPPGGNWLMSEGSVLLIPAIPLAAWGIGEACRAFVALTDEARSDFALVVLPGYFLIAGLLVLLFSRAMSRGKDGRSR
jgi:hypothetical protein